MTKQVEEIKPNDLTSHGNSERDNHAGAMKDNIKCLGSNDLSLSIPADRAIAAKDQHKNFEVKFTDRNNDDLDEFAITEIDPLYDEEDMEGGSHGVNPTLKITSTPSPKEIHPDRYVSWESLGSGRTVGDRVVRTFEDITLTDTSRYVLS